MSACEVDQINSGQLDQTEKMGVANMMDTSDQKLVDILLDFSETCLGSEALLDVIDLQEVESLKPWQSVAPVPKFTQASTQKKRKVIRESDDPNYDTDEKQMTTKNYRRYLYPKQDRETTAWKECVEPTTFRYVPNNGTYRASKSEQKMAPPQHTRPQPRKPCEKLSPEQKHLQREIQRELRKEYESSSQASAESYGNSVRDSVDTLHLLNISDNRHPNSAKSSAKTSASVTPQPSAAALSYKAVSDRIFENFANRISSLDEEMKNDIRLYKKLDENMTIKTTRSRSEPNSSRTRDSSKSVVKSDTSQQQPKAVLSYEELAKAKPVLHHDHESKHSGSASRLKNRFDKHTQKKFTEFKYHPKFGLGDLNIIQSIANHKENAKKNDKNPALDKPAKIYKNPHPEGHVCSKETLENLLTTSTFGPATKKNKTPTPQMYQFAADLPQKAAANSYSESQVTPDDDRGNPVSGGILPEIAGKRLEIPLYLNR